MLPEKAFSITVFIHIHGKKTRKNNKVFHAKSTVTKCYNLVGNARKVMSKSRYFGY